MHCPSFRISFRRRNHPPGGSYWDPFWANSLLNAAKHRGHQPISVNDGMFFDSAEECDAVKSLAEEMWREMREQHQREVEHISANHMVLRAQHQPKSNQATDLWQLPTLAPDPEPPANELLPYIDRMLEAQTRYEMARLRWRAAKEKVDPDAFIVPIVTNEEKYTRYLSTLRWKRIRLVVLEEADGTCRGCSAEATQVHHRDYRPRVLKGDDLRPLVALCHTCHQRVHKDENGQRRASWNECERVLAELVSFRSEALGKSAAPGG